MSVEARLWRALREVEAAAHEGEWHPLRGDTQTAPAHGDADPA